MTTYPMSARQRLVGWCLRQARERAGYDLGDAARVLDCHPSKISRIEVGQRGIRVKELRELLAEYGADGATEETLTALARPGRNDTGWWSEYGGVLPAPYLELASAEAFASAIAVYAPLQVPELLQVPGYARAAAAADPAVPGEHEASAAAAVVNRQRATLEERATPVDVVIGEAALRHRTGGPIVMRAQLSHLADIAGRSSHVTIRLLPFTAGASPAGGGGGFTVLRFGPAPSLGLVHLAGPSGGLCPGDPQAADGYLRAFEHLQARALKPEHTVRRLWELTRSL
jgi:hypothetical protein